MIAIPASVRPDKNSKLSKPFLVIHASAVKPKIIDILIHLLIEVLNH
jgi:hypothetical protein